MTPYILFNVYICGYFYRSLTQSTKKTIENVWDRETVKICRSKEELLQSVSKKTYKRQAIVNEDMVIVAHKKLVVYYNKPFYIGFSILDISKYIMYDYYYNILENIS